MEFSTSPFLNATLTHKFPRDFSRIPFRYRSESPSDDNNANLALNQAIDDRRLSFLEQELFATLKHAVETKSHPMLTTALMPGGNVILDALYRCELLHKVPIVLVDTLHLYPETLLHLKELEQKYHFTAEIYRPIDFPTIEEFQAKYGDSLWETDTELYDSICKIEPMNRALQHHQSDCWINGRRRDHGYDRANLVVWEDTKLNPLAYWTYEDCWSYLRKHQVPYHPFHDVGFPSLGDMHSSARLPLNKWFEFGGERAARFLNMQNSDGSPKTECGIHTKISLKSH